MYSIAVLPDYVCSIAVFLNLSLVCSIAVLPESVPRVFFVCVFLKISIAVLLDPVLVYSVAVLPESVPVCSVTV